MKTIRNILVIGATGKTGRRVVERLQQLDQPVRLGSRSQDPHFDWDDPATWPAALAGMDKAYIVYYPDLAVPGAFEAISGLTRAAKDAGLQKLVLLSGKGEPEAERCEQVVAGSGLAYTLVRASWFNQNFSESFFLGPVLAGHLALPMPHAKIPFVDADDIAEVVVEALLNDAHNGKTYELTGPRLLTFADVAEEIARATGRKINFEAVSLEAYEEKLEAEGTPSSYIWLFNYLFSEVLGRPENAVISTDIEEVLGRKARDFADFAEEAAQSRVWNPAIAV